MTWYLTQNFIGQLFGYTRVIDSNYSPFEHPKANTYFVISLFMEEPEPSFFVYKLFMAVPKLGIFIVACCVGKFGTLLGTHWQNFSVFALCHPELASQ